MQIGDLDLKVLKLPHPGLKWLKDGFIQLASQTLPSRSTLVHSLFNQLSQSFVPYTIFMGKVDFGSWPSGQMNYNLPIAAVKECP